VSFEGDYWNVKDSQVVPFRGRKFRVVLGGTFDRTYDLAAKHGWGRPIPFPGMKDSADRYKRTSTATPTTRQVREKYAAIDPRD
jgi:alkanesulfonate monooxygenase SsuD/methylene tetrahydromethanopterin reductase-like flavin-dependent oxidoreductase (luciferase family)